MAINFYLTTIHHLSNFENWLNYDKLTKTDIHAYIRTGQTHSSPYRWGKK